MEINNKYFYKVVKLCVNCIASFSMHTNCKKFIQILQKHANEFPKFQVQMNS